MNLAELRTQLAQYADLPGETPVVLAEDAEGNGFSPLADASPAMYLAESSFHGEHYMTEEQRQAMDCLLYTSPSPRDGLLSRMPSSA